MTLIVRHAEAEDLNILTELMYEYIVGFYQKPRPATEKIHHLIQSLLEKQISQNHGYSYMPWITAAENKRAQQFFEIMGGAKGDWVNYSIV